MSTLHARINGIAYWSDGLDSWQAACQYVADGQLPAEAARRPSPQLLAANERRRAPDTVAVALDVALAACNAAGVDPAQLPSVFASCHGELGITDYMCRTLAEDPASLSPTRFHNSVHNAAAGYWTIGAGAHTPATALSAGPWSFAQGLLEALVQLADGAQQVLLVSYDGAASGPLATQAPSAGLLGTALVLGRDGPGPSLQVQWGPTDNPAQPGPLQQRAQANAGAAMLALFDALASGQTQLQLAAGPAHSLHIGIDHAA